MSTPACAPAAPGPVPSAAMPAGKRPAPPWHRVPAFADCGTRCWVFPGLDIRVHEPTREVFVAGRAVPLEPRPFGMLMMLLRQTDRFLTRDMLRDMLWAGRRTTDASLNKCASKVRQALGGDGGQLLLVAYGLGYRLTQAPRPLPTTLSLAA